MKTSFALVVAADVEGGIGLDGGLPWHIPEDLKYFRAVTVGEKAEGVQNIVIMGRKTWESLPDAYRPLKDRINIVLTRQADYDLPSGVVRATSLDEALGECGQCIDEGYGRDVFVIGGGQIFEDAIRRPECRAIYFTRAGRSFSCDVFFPPIPPEFSLASTRHEVSIKGIPLDFLVYRRSDI